MRALVTGGGGFVGQWLARALLARGDETFLAGPGAAGDSPRILSDDEWRAAHWIRTDIRRDDDVAAMVEASNPDVVFHLAGISFVPQADRAPTLAYDVNLLGAVRLFGALAARRSAGFGDPVVVVVGTGTQYGNHDAREMPLTEDAEQRPIGAYAASKAAQEVVALQVARDTGLRVVCARSFNHSGAGHDPHFLLPALVNRVVALARAPGGGAPSLALGNDTVRDYLHVHDVVQAYLRLAEYGAEDDAKRGQTGRVFNVCSGVGVSVRELAETVLQRAGVSAEISTDSSLTRPTDISVLVGSPERLQRATGWTPVRTIADIIDDLLNAQTD